MHQLGRLGSQTAGPTFPRDDAGNNNRATPLQRPSMPDRPRLCVPRGAADGRACSAEGERCHLSIACWRIACQQPEAGRSLFRTGRNTRSPRPDREARGCPRARRPARDGGSNDRARPWRGSRPAWCGPRRHDRAREERARSSCEHSGGQHRMPDSAVRVPVHRPSARPLHPPAPTHSVPAPSMPRSMLLSKRHRSFRGLIHEAQYETEQIECLSVGRIRIECSQPLDRVAQQSSAVVNSPRCMCHSPSAVFARASNASRLSASCQ